MGWFGHWSLCPYLGIDWVEEFQWASLIFTEPVYGLGCGGFVPKFGCSLTLSQVTLSPPSKERINMLSLKVYQEKFYTCRMHNSLRYDRMGEGRELYHPSSLLINFFPIDVNNWETDQASELKSPRKLDRKTSAQKHSFPSTMFVPAQFWISQRLWNYCSLCM